MRVCLFGIPGIYLVVLSLLISKVPPSLFPVPLTFEEFSQLSQRLWHILDLSLSVSSWYHLTCSSVAWIFCILGVRYRGMIRCRLNSFGKDTSCRYCHIFRLHHKRWHVLTSFPLMIPRWTSWLNWCLPHLSIVEVHFSLWGSS